MKNTIFSTISVVLFLLAATQIHAQNGDGKTIYRIIKTADASLILSRPRVTDIDENKTENAATDRNSREIFGFEREVFVLINAKRREQNLSPLIWNETVAKIAREHSQNMANAKFFSHAGLDGTMVSDRADRAGLGRWRAIGENIAYNQGFKKPLDCAVEGWMNSPSHKENLLDPNWKESAVGIAVTADGTYYFTQVFLVRK